MFQTVSSATVILPLLLLVAILLPLLLVTRLIRLNTSQIVALLAFIVYGFAVLDVTLFPMRVVPEALRRDSLIPSSINLTPFANIGEASFVLNIIMMIPLGFLLPCIAPKLASLRNVSIAGFLASASIEGMQLFTLLTFGNRRIVDVDDLIANTGGAMIGFAIWFALVGLAASVVPDTEHEQEHEQEQRRHASRPTW
ncbi:MAG: VanZ family protein [Thermomicrobiales bacterium]